MNVFSKVFIIVFFLSTIKTYAFEFYFKYPFINVSKCTIEIVDYSSKNSYEVISYFTHKKEVWRVERFQRNRNRKSLDSFIVFDGMNYEKYNHKRAKIEIGNLIKKDKNIPSISITNAQGEQIGLVKYVFNEFGFVLSVTQFFFNSDVQKEIQSITSHFQYNCFNQITYYSKSYEYFISTHKYKRKENEEYVVVNCNPDTLGNCKDIYYHSQKNNEIVKFEKRYFVYN